MRDPSPPVEVRKGWRSFWQSFHDPPWSQTFLGTQTSRLKAGPCFVAAELAVWSGLLLVLVKIKWVCWQPVKNSPADVLNAGKKHTVQKHVCLRRLFFKLLCLSVRYHYLLYLRFSDFKTGRGTGWIFCCLLLQHCIKKQRYLHFFQCITRHFHTTCTLKHWNQFCVNLRKVPSLRSWCSVGRTKAEGWTKVESLEAGQRQGGGGVTSGVICQGQTVWSSWWQPCTLQQRENTDWQAVVHSLRCVSVHVHRAQSVRWQFDWAANQWRCSKRASGCPNNVIFSFVRRVGSLCDQLSTVWRQWSDKAYSVAV